MTDFDTFGSFAGSTHPEGEPGWGPLERLTDDDPLLLGRFMWMGEVRLEDGRRLQAYKHIDTRRYLYLSDELDAFEYRGHPEEHYLTSSLATVLRECFCELRELAGPELAEIEAAEALIERHTSRPRAA
ncbi:MAG: hypothetical protein H0V81_05420 [Solirubrobacterales bacterium]|nr:hypothetical protein [Solirubrobacterales bacterium]